MKESDPLMLRLRRGSEQNVTSFVEREFRNHHTNYIVINNTINNTNKVKDIANNNLTKDVSNTKIKTTIPKLSTDITSQLI